MTRMQKIEAALARIEEFNAADPDGTRIALEETYGLKLTKSRDGVQFKARMLGLNAQSTAGHVNALANWAAAARRTLRTAGRAR